MGQGGCLLFGFFYTAVVCAFFVFGQLEDFLLTCEFCNSAGQKESKPSAWLGQTSWLCQASMQQ